MSVSQLTPSAQNYVKVIWGLQEWSAAPVSASIIAEKTGLKLSTVSDAVRKLTEQGLLDHTPYASITLTEIGRAHAVAIVRRHRLIETFLVQTLHYGWDEVHDEAETLEHAVSDVMVDRIDELLGFPTTDPHGDPIPSADGTVHLPDAVQLTTVAPGKKVRVARISDSDPGLLQFFESKNIALGTLLTVAPGTPYSDAVEVFAAGSTSSISLGRAATDSVWVSLDDEE